MTGVRQERVKRGEKKIKNSACGVNEKDSFPGDYV